MVVDLDLTEKAIACFNDCAKKGNYVKFAEENKTFIRSLIDNLKKVKFGADDALSHEITQQSKFIFAYLASWDPRYPKTRVSGTTVLERNIPTFIGSLKNAISTKNWNNFYLEYYPTADFIINEARNQGIFDLQIEYGSSSYDTFADRDFVAQSKNQRQYDSPVRQEDPIDLRNSGGMIKYQGREAEEYHLKEQEKLKNMPQLTHRTQKQNFHQSGQDGVTVIPIQMVIESTIQMRKDAYQHPEQNDQRGLSQQQAYYGKSPTTPPYQSSLQSSREHRENPLSSCNSAQPSIGTSRKATLDNSPGIRLHTSQIPDQTGFGHVSSTNPIFYRQPSSPQNPSQLYNQSSQHSVNSSSFEQPPSPQQNTSLYGRYQGQNSTNNTQTIPYDSRSSSHSSTEWNTSKPSKEYVPAISADLALQTLRPPENIVDHSAVYNPDQDIYKYQHELKETIPLGKYEPKSFTPRSTESSLRERSLCRDSPLSDNSAFDRVLAEQNIKNARELEMKKKERKEKQKEFEDELRKLKEESKRRFEMLLMCIMARQRFEIQEQNWMDWISGCRQNISQLLNRWNDFADDVEREFKGFRRPERIDQQDLQMQTNHFLSSVMMTYNILQFDFEKLEDMERTYPDALFVRVLMKCIADVAGTLLKIYELTEDLGYDKSKLFDLQSKMNRLRPDLIYSTHSLRDVCKTATSSDYSHVSFPIFHQNVKIQEL